MAASKQTTRGIKSWVEFHNITVASIAEKSGASKPTVYAWLNGTSTPSVDQARELEEWKPGFLSQIKLEPST